MTMREVTIPAVPEPVLKFLSESLVVGLLIAAVVLVVKLWPIVRKLSRFLDDVTGEEARPGFERRPGLMERVGTLERELAEVQQHIAELRGVPATIERIEPAVAELHDQYVKPHTGPVERSST